MDKARTKSPIALMVFGVITMALVGALIWAAFFYAPVESSMGIAQKIFYFHVPSAYAMYLGFGICAIGSIAFLISRKDLFDAIAVAGAEVGLMFCLIVLVTGPLWARKAWGVYWTWDPRLTTTVLAAMIFTSYVVLRGLGGGGEIERRFASGLAIVGLADLPIIHYSVKQWRGQHPTVITSGGGGITAEMGQALGLGFLAFTALAIFLIWSRVRIERAKQTLSELELEAAERGLLEDV
jgi:heme exporter protein C